MSIRGEFKISPQDKEDILFQGDRLRESKVTASKDGITIDGHEYLSNKLKIIPLHDATIYLNDRRLRGEVDIVKGINENFLVINTIDLEKYIGGVLYHEISHHWPMGAIEAQAVAARTYALYRIEQSRGKDFDLTNDIYSQVYGGRTSERYRTNIAVTKTKGLVMKYNGKVLPAYYHATCAGHTEDARELWNEDLLPLKGITCPYCASSPHYTWKRNLRLKDIQDKLNASGYHLDLIKEIAVVDRNESGRIRSLRITTRDGNTAAISGKDFRNIIGPNEIRSNNYQIVMLGYYVDFLGRGWGHGVGLCQWGANFMAKDGYDFKQILKFYYPGVEIVSYEAQ